MDSSEFNWIHWVSVINLKSGSRCSQLYAEFESAVNLHW
jgi:hypothetical protein